MSNHPWSLALLVGLSAVSAAVVYKLFKNPKATSTTNKGVQSSDEEKVNELVLKRFQACSEYMQTRISKLPQATQLELYAWYKQANEGSLDDTKTKIPRSYDLVGTAKYNAWKKLQGMSKSSAMQLYIDKAMLVEFTASMQDDGNDDDGEEVEDAIMDIGGMGNKPSTLNYDDESGDENHHVDNSSNPLHEAAMSGNLQELQKLLNNGGGNAGVDPNTQDSTGQTALHLCADRGHLDCLDLLVQSGAKVDIGDQDGITPLQTAVISGHVQICERLLEAGADPDKPDHDGDTPRASAEDDADIAALLAKYPSK